MVVARRDELEGLDEELADTPERPTVVVGRLTSGEAEPLSIHRRSRCSNSLRARARLSSSSAAGAQNSPAIVAQASELHERGIRIRTLALFYEQWLGKQPIGELERMSLLFDIGEMHAHGSRGSSDSSTSPWHSSDLSRWPWSSRW